MHARKQNPKHGELHWREDYRESLLPVTRNASWKLTPPRPANRPACGARTLRGHAGREWIDLISSHLRALERMEARAQSVGSESPLATWVKVRCVVECGPNLDAVSVKQVE